MVRKLIFWLPARQCHSVTGAFFCENGHANTACITAFAAETRTIRVEGTVISSFRGQIRGE